METRQLEMAEKAGIRLPTILPLFDSPPDEKAMTLWVDAQLPELRTIAEKIVKNINYINFEKFMAQLQATINDFNKRNQGPYVLWIAQPNKRSREGCSDAWVAGLALEYCGLRCPEAIVYTDDLPDYIIKHPEMTNFLLLDDAAYSGKHVSSEFSNVYQNLYRSGHLESLNINLFIGIPYMTQAAEEMVLKNPRLKPQLLKHAPIKHMKHMFDKEELAYLEKIKFSIRNMGLTYFAHRFPDIFSIFQNLLTGANIIWGPMVKPAMQSKGYTTANHSPEEWYKLLCQFFPGTIPIVPNIVPPYYLEFQRGKEALANVLRSPTHSTRTSYALPERCSDARKLLNAAGIAVDGSPFQMPKVAEEPLPLEEKEEKEENTLEANVVKEPLPLKEEKIQVDSPITSAAAKEKEVKEEKEEDTLEAIESAIKNHTYILGCGLWSGRSIEDQGKRFTVSTGARDVFNIIKNAKIDRVQGKEIDEQKIAHDIRDKIGGSKQYAHNGFFCIGARHESTASLHQRIFQIANNIDKRLQRQI